MEPQCLVETGEYSHMTHMEVLDAEDSAIGHTLGENKVRSDNYYESPFARGSCFTNKATLTF